MRFKLLEWTDAREMYIYELERYAHLFYKWDKYTTAQIYKMWQRNANVITPAREKEIMDDWRKEQQSEREAKRKASEPKQLQMNFDNDGNVIDID